MPLTHAGISALEIARKRAGLTAAELARATGVSPSHISQIERGWRTPSASMKLRVASVLEAPVGKLFPTEATPALLAVVAAADHSISDNRAATRPGRAADTSSTCQDRARHDAA